MSGSVSGDRLVLLGGVGLQTSPDVVVVHLTHRSWFGLGLQVSFTIMKCISYGIVAFTAYLMEFLFTKQPT